MLPRDVRQQFKLLTDADLDSWILIGPMQLCYSVPMYTDILKGAARLVAHQYRKALHDGIYDHAEYIPKYKSVEELTSMRYFKQITDADLEDTSPETLSNYLNSVNLMIYLNQKCRMCKHYITDVGIDDIETRTVTQCINCGHIELDTITQTQRHWVTNLTGVGKGTYTDD